ncbi:MAG: membrane protein insertion efficiency factor YidD [Candidatus Zixiibacteriota bacterium]|nr:MAG: membrane protein insertion efficiency factor YidD [candidate division Zixibacteria bacterium]
MPNSTGYSNSSPPSRNKTSLWAYPLIFVLYLYRFTLSPLIGNNCRFHPTCSQYAEQALRKYGALRGSIKAVRRLLRCHPWHEGGYDPIR